MFKCSLIKDNYPRSQLFPIIMFVEFCVVISPVPFILGSLMGGRSGTLGVGTAKLCTLSDDWDLKKNICQRHPD